MRFSRLGFFLLLTTALLHSCLKDNLIQPEDPTSGASRINIASLQSQPSGNALCEQKTGTVIVTGTQNFDFFTTGTPDSFYKKNIPCSEFRFRVERVNSIFDKSGLTVGSVNERCELRLDDSVAPSSGQSVKIFVSHRDYPQEIKDTFIQCVKPSGSGGSPSSTPTPTPIPNPTPVPTPNVNVSAVYLKNNNVADLCSNRRGQLVIEGYRDHVFYSTEFGWAQQWGCSDFDFTINKVNWAGVVTQYSVGDIDYLCNLRLWFSHDDGYIQVRARYKHASRPEGVGQWSCE